MPYATVTELPENIKSKYSDKAQKAYMETFNSIYAQTKDEARAFAAAASAANKIDGIVPKGNPFAKVEPGKEVEFMEASFHVDGCFSEAPRLDEDAGVYKIPVTLIKPGMSKNKVFYSDAWLGKFAEAMNGGKAYLDHEKKSEIKDRSSRSVRDMAGWYEDVKQDSDMSVKGLLNLVETPSTEHVIKLAKANPELVGLSINARGKASRGKVNGESAMIAETIEKVYSTDIVTEAAAGGEMMRFAASVSMDIEQITDDKIADDNALEDKQMEESIKDNATWLVAEAAYKADMKTWLTLESAHNEKVQAEEAKILESVMETVPDKFKDVCKGLDSEKVKAFVEALKDEPAEAKTPPASDNKKPEVKPGEEGYQRKFL